MFSDISNRDKSNKENTNKDNTNKDNPGFGNLKVNSKDNLRFNSQNNNLRRKFSGRRDDLRRKFISRKDKSKDLRLSNHNTLSLKENLKEGRGKIESRRLHRIQASAVSGSRGISAQVISSRRI